MMKMMPSTIAILLHRQCHLRTLFNSGCTRKLSQLTSCHTIHRTKRIFNQRLQEINFDTSVPINNCSRFHISVGQQSALDNKVETEEEFQSDLFKDLSPEDARKLKILQLEYDVWFSMGHRVPQEVTDAMWLQLLNECQTVSSRRKMFVFWAKREIMREKGRKKKELSRLARASVEKKEVDPSEPYANRIFQSYTKSRMNELLYFNNLVFAMLHGPHLVFDLGFEDHMRKREMTNMVEQLSVSHGYNNLQQEPFHFHFCNVQENSIMEEVLYKRFTGLKNIPYTVTDKSYLDCYPKEDLVYLSPNAPKVMTEFNHHDIYIIGGIVDKAGQEPLTFAKAKREGIRCMKLPLDKYLNWNIGSKALTLDQMVKIMERLKSTNSDWFEALQSVPKRKFTWR